MPFRYDVTPLPKINTFIAKPIPSDANKMELRASLLGAMFKGSYTSMPTAMAQIAWEAPSVPPFDTIDP